MSHFFEKGYIMKTLLSIFSCVVLLAACSKKAAETPQNTQTQTVPTQTTPPAKQDVSTEALVKIDPEIQKFEDATATAKKLYEIRKDDASRSKLVQAYISFGDYMQYESPVSPRQGKYHRSLLEYRNALELDSQNRKVQAEITQIEDIYRSMGRPIPGRE